MDHRIGSLTLAEWFGMVIPLTVLCLCLFRHIKRAQDVHTLSGFSCRAAKSCCCASFAFRMWRSLPHPTHHLTVIRCNYVSAGEPCFQLRLRAKHLIQIAAGKLLSSPFTAATASIHEPTKNRTTQLRCVTGKLRECLYTV